MTAHPYDLGPQREPHASDYKPRKLTSKTSDVEAAQELLAWMRCQGFAAASVVVGSVQIVGLVDQYPRKQEPAKATEADLFDDVRLR